VDRVGIRRNCSDLSAFSFLLRDEGKVSSSVADEGRQGINGP
jgi:hypothetical protein